MPEDEYHRTPCDLCKRLTINGPHRYDGQAPSHLGGLFLCKTCLSGHSDGVSPPYEKAFVEAMARRGAPLPARNAKGLFSLAPPRR